MTGLRLLALLALCSAALVAAGCGGGADVKSSNAYVDDVNKAQTDFAKTIDSLSGRITQKSTPAEDHATMRNFTTAVGRVVTDLKAIKPPDKVSALHSRLVSEISGYGRQVDAAAASLTSRNADRLLAAQQQLLKATSTVSGQINTTIAAINTKLHK